MKKLFQVFLIMLLALPAFADNKPFKQIGTHKIVYSAFNSSFIQPDIASTYNIVRGKDKGLVTIAIVPDGSESGRAAHVEGYVSNIFAQQQFLKFIEIREGDAVYYLAPFEFENEDSLTFKLKVRATSDATDEHLTFQKVFYHD